MGHFTTVKSFIDAFPGRQALADDLSVLCGTPITVDRIHKWALSGSIPAKYHLVVVRAAASRGVPVTAEQLDEMHALDVCAQPQGDAA